jgi:hypothetical protein
VLVVTLRRPATPRGCLPWLLRRARP